MPDGFLEHGLVLPVVLGAGKVDLDPFTHLASSHRLERDGVRVRFQELGGRLLRKLDPNSLLIETDAELLPSIVSRETEHFAGPDMGIAQQQAIENGLVFGIEARHCVLLSARRRASGG
jgi:hypothetical protein